MALTCTTSESNPTAVVIWTRDGAPVSADPSDIITESGKYDALKRINTLRVTATRVLNGMVYKCAVQGISLTEEYTMVITCKYMFTIKNLKQFSAINMKTINPKARAIGRFCPAVIKYIKFYFDLCDISMTWFQIIQTGSTKFIEVKCVGL